MRLIGALYEWLLFVHIVAAMIWVGAVAVMNVQATLLLRQSEAADVRRFTRLLRTLGLILLMPVVVVLLAFGIWLVFDGGWEFEQTWVWLGIALFAFAFIVGAAFQSRRRRRRARSKRGRSRHRRCAAAAVGVGDASHRPPARRRHMGHGREARDLIRRLGLGASL